MQGIYAWNDLDTPTKVDVLVVIYRRKAREGGYGVAVSTVGSVGAKKIRNRSLVGDVFLMSSSDRFRVMIASYMCSKEKGKRDGVQRRVTCCSYDHIYR